MVEITLRFLFQDVDAELNNKISQFAGNLKIQEAVKIIIRNF